MLEHLARELKNLRQQKEHEGVKDVCFKDELNFERKKKIAADFFQFCAATFKIRFQ